LVADVSWTGCPVNSYQGFVEMGSVSLGNQQAADIADLEQYQFASVGNAVGVADVKQVPAPIGIAKGGNILHALL